MLNDKPKVGIMQRIRVCNSFAEIELLLATIHGYKHAHPSTVRKCERVAQQRVDELNKPKP